MKKRLFVLASLALVGMGLGACQEVKPNPDSSVSESQKEETHAITLQSGEGYALSANADKAKEGETVTLTLAITDETKLFDAFVSEDVSVKVLSSDLTAASIKGSFAMPDKAVTIGVKLKEKPAPVVTHKVNVATSEDYAISLSKAEYEVGETVTFALSIQNEKKQFSKFQLDGADFAYETLEATATSVKASFAMPDKDVTLSAVLTDKAAEKKAISAITNYSPKYLGKVSVQVGDKYSVGEDVTLTVKPSTVNFSSSIYGKIYVYVGTTMYLPTYNSEEAYSANEATVTFKMPNEDTAISLFADSSSRLDEEEGHKVTVTADEHLTVLGVNPGAKYSRPTLNVAREKGYKVSKVEYKFAGDSAFTEASLDASKVTNGILSFTPWGYNPYSLEKDVEIRVTSVQDDSYHAIKHVNGENVSAGANYSLPDYAYEGEKIDYDFEATNGYFVPESGDSWSIEGASDEGYGTNVAFTMGTSDVTVTYNLVIGQTISIATNDQVKRAFVVDKKDKEVSTGLPNSTYTLFVEPIDGYVPTSFAVNGGEAVSLSKYYGSSFEGNLYFEDFKMPNEAASIAISTAKGYKFSTTGDTEHLTFNTKEGTYPAGERVGVGINITSGYRLVEGSAKIVGHDDIEVTVEESSWQGTFLYFTMPEYDVQLTAAVEKIPTSSVTVSYVDATPFSDLTVKGLTSNTRMEDVGTNANFFKGEKLSIYGEVSSSDYKSVKLVVTFADGSASIERTVAVESNAYYNSFDFDDDANPIVLSGDVSISLEALKTAVSA